MTRAAARRPRWPGDKRFAFSIFDDTDFATVERVAPIYRLLSDLGMSITKSVWTHATDERTEVDGVTCDDPAYVAWLQSIREQGHEVGWHNATHASSDRLATAAGLDRFRGLFGSDPGCGADHGGNREALYPGSHRVTGVRRKLYHLSGRHQATGLSGHCEASPYFWGDLASERVRYYRGFTFGDIDTLAACPWMPYHDPAKPWIRRWFAASDGPRSEHFTRILSDEGLDRLEHGGGACILYAHLGLDFTADGKVDPGVEDALRRVAARDGWFVPVTMLLDHLASERGVTVLTPHQRRQLEWRWLRHKARVGKTL